MKLVLCDTKIILSSKELQSSDYNQAVNNMIGIIYTVDLVQQQKKKSTPMPGANIFRISIDDAIALFPDFNKRLHDIGIESR